MEDVSPDDCNDYFCKAQKNMATKIDNNIWIAKWIKYKMRSSIINLNLPR